MRSVRIVARRYARGQCGEATGLAAGAAEGDQHVQACHEVEEVVAQHRQRPPLAPGRPLGVQPDEDHEQRDERHGQPDDHPGERVGDQDPDRDGGRHHRGDEQRGQVAAEVALEPVEPAGGQRGQLTGRRQVGVAGAEPQDVRDQGGPQGAHDVGRRAVRGDLARPREPGPDGHHREHAEQGGAEVAQARPAEERGAQHPGQQLGLHHHQTRGRYGEGGGRDDEPPRGRGVPQQPWVEGSHRDAAPVGRRPMWAGMSAGLMRRRNTQSVQAW